METTPLGRRDVRIGGHSRALTRFAQRGRMAPPLFARPAPRRSAVAGTCRLKLLFNYSATGPIFTPCRFTKPLERNVRNSRMNTRRRTQVLLYTFGGENIEGAVCRSADTRGAAAGSMHIYSNDCREHALSANLRSKSGLIGGNIEQCSPLIRSPFCRRPYRPR
jgi:hypothetical protein